MDTNTNKKTNEKNQAKPLTLFIVDNQPLYREAIRKALEGEVEVVGESGFEPDIWSTIESISPDIALVDIGLPSFNGFGIARHIATRCPGVAVVMLTPNPDDDQLFQAIKAGAVAFISKDISTHFLIIIFNIIIFPICKTNTIKFITCYVYIIIIYISIQIKII